MSKIICDKVYEYKRLSRLNAEKDIQFMNELGQNGWRLVKTDNYDMLFERVSIKV